MSFADEPVRRLSSAAWLRCVSGTAGMAYLWRRSAASAEAATNALHQLEKSQRDREWWMSAYARLDQEERRKFREFQRFIRENPAVAALEPVAAIEVFNRGYPELALAPNEMFATAPEGGTEAAATFGLNMIGD